MKGGWEQKAMPSLNSSCLAWVEFDSGTMYLRFRNGGSYTLHGVPEHHYRGLLNTTSPGWYFNTYLLGQY
jgi:KTSC domain-containing protein